LIVLASDHVGCEVVRFLVERGEHISFLLTDSEDRGGYNKKIEEIFKSGNQGGMLASGELLSEGSFLDQIAASKPQIGLSAWWPRILKGKILDIPEQGWLNFHPAYLPFNKGKHPSFWCLVDETPAGVTLHYIDEDIDTGPIVARDKLEVTWEDTGESIYKRSRELILKLFREKYDDIMENRLERIPQDDVGTFHWAREIDSASCIDLDATYTGRELLNIMRARIFPPYPTSYFSDGGKKFSVQIKIEEIKNGDKG